MIINAIVAFGIILITDLLLEKLTNNKKSLLNKSGIRMIVSYSIGIMIYILILKIFI